MFTHTNSWSFLYKCFNHYITCCHFNWNRPKQWTCAAVERGCGSLSDSNIHIMAIYPDLLKAHLIITQNAFIIYWRFCNVLMFLNNEIIQAMFKYIIQISVLPHDKTVWPCCFEPQHTRLSQLRNTSATWVSRLLLPSWISQASSSSVAPFLQTLC